MHKPEAVLNDTYKIHWDFEIEMITESQPDQTLC